MKNLKFRTYHHKMKKMLTVRCIDFHNKVFDCIDGDECFLVKFQDCEIMQSTGLTDKNGKEIYEGDILRLYNEEDNYELFIEVIFNYKSCCWGNKIKNNTDDLGHSDILYNYNLNITEIVGNIHENPELLNS